MNTFGLKKYKTYLKFYRLFKGNTMNWKKTTDATGKTYWVNQVTGERTFTDPTGSQSGNTSSSNNSGGGDFNIGKQDAKWIDSYYNDYVTKMNEVGLTPLGKNEMYAKYAGSGEINFEAVRKAYEKPIAETLKTKINDLKKQQHDWNPDIPFTAYNGATDYDSLISAYQNTQIETTANKPKNIKDDGTVDETLDSSGKKKYVFTPSELMMQEEARLKAEAEAPDAVRPEYNYDASNTGKYFDTISKSEQAGTDKAVSAVNETANFVNPYATGSGSQIKAVTGMLDNITANQQARAFALGQNEYDRNYTGQYADYEKTQAKKTAARQGLLNLSQYYTQMAGEADNKNEANYWKTLGLQNEANLATLQAQAEDKKYQRDTELLAKSAELNKQQSSDWWTPFVSTAVGAFTGGLGTAAVNAVTGNTTSNYLNQLAKYGLIKQA
jgi:hypothetical protein